MERRLYVTTGVSGDHMGALAPGLLKDVEAFDRVLDRLVAYGQALIGCERNFRHADEQP